MLRRQTQILIDYIVAQYPESVTQNNATIIGQLKNIITNYVCQNASYEDCSAASQTLTGTTTPIDKLRDILTISPDPIPFQGETDTMKKKSRCWSPYEDDRLVAGIFRYGVDNWTSISNFVGNGRTRSQCSQRWQRGLDPRLSKDQWSVAEEALLFQLVQYFGEKSWTQIAMKMGNRSDVQCRYHYKQMQKERARLPFKQAAPNFMQPGNLRPSQSQPLMQFQPIPHYEGLTNLPTLDPTQQQQPFPGINNVPRYLPPPIPPQTQKLNIPRPPSPPARPSRPSFDFLGSFEDVFNMDDDVFADNSINPTSISVNETDEQNQGGSSSVFDADMFSIF